MFDKRSKSRTIDKGFAGYLEQWQKRHTDRESTKNSQGGFRFVVMEEQPRENNFINLARNSIRKALR